MFAFKIKPAKHTDGLDMGLQASKLSLRYSPEQLDK